MGVMAIIHRFHLELGCRKNITTRSSLNATSMELRLIPSLLRPVCPCFRVLHIITSENAQDSCASDHTLFLVSCLPSHLFDIRMAAFMPCSGHSVPASEIRRLHLSKRLLIRGIQLLIFSLKC